MDSVNQSMTQPANFFYLFIINIINIYPIPMLQHCLLIVACWFKKSLYYSPSITNFNKKYLIKHN